MEGPADQVVPGQPEEPGGPGGPGGPGELSGDPRAEADLVASLAEKKFQGALWERFVNDLAIVGLRVLVPWIGSGRIFAELRRKSIPCRQPVGIPDPDAEHLAAETVARAIEPFRVKMLVSGRWDPDGGARLSTLFITQCLHQFPNAYRDWVRRGFGGREELPGDPDVARVVEGRARGDPVGTGAGSAEDPEAAVISREECEELLDLLPDRLRAVIQLVARGHTFREAAERNDEDPVALQRALWRIRPRLRQARLRRGNEVDP